MRALSRRWPSLAPAADSWDRAGRQTPLRVEVYTSVEAVEQEWDQLADAAGVAPFLRPAWVGAWWRAFGSGTLRIVALRSGGSGGPMVALVALQERLGRVLSTSNWHTPQFGMVAADEAAASALAAALFHRRPIELALGFVDGPSPELARYRSAAAAAGYRVLERTLERSPKVATDGTWEAYAQQQLSRNRRSQLGRCWRRLQREGCVGVETATGGERLEEILEEAFAVEGAGWKGAQGTAIASRPETRRFYQEVAQWAAGKGWLRVAFLRLDGRALAVMCLLETNQVLYYLKGGYDPAFERFSPGMVLLGRVLRAAFDGETKRVELLGGDERYKGSFAKDAQDKVRFQAFEPSALGRLSWAAFAHGRPLAKQAVAVARRVGERVPSR